ncbi:MAG: hypothetical protein RL748_4030 [Pseudomonadota bacterium]
MAINMKLLPPEAYQAELAKRYESVAANLRRFIPSALIEHIGSSAVAGAVSKADLDICVIVDAAELATVVRILQQQGYTEKLDTLRTAELCMLEWSQQNADHAVQVVASGSRFETFFVDFRNLLRAKPELVEQYNQIKLKSAGLGVEKYREAKSQFIAAALAAKQNEA